MHGRGAVADRVGDEFADDQFGCIGGVFVHVPVCECPAGVCAGGGGCWRVVLEEPGGKRAGREGPGAGEEEDGVAGAVLAAEGVEDVVAQVLERSAGLGKDVVQECGGIVGFGGGAGQIAGVYRARVLPWGRSVVVAAKGDLPRRPGQAPRYCPGPRCCCRGG